jgi:hypothetical protein
MTLQDLANCKETNTLFRAKFRAIKVIKNRYGFIAIVLRIFFLLHLMSYGMSNFVQ